MDLLDQIQNYKPKNEQEKHDKEQMLQFLSSYDNYLERENQIGHFTASVWTVNKERTKTLMVHHNLYNSWSWVGGHADGMEDLQAVAMKELQEETGVKNAKFISDEIFSIETLNVNGHVKRGVWVSGHLHFNVTYLVEVDEGEELISREDENSAVQWFAFDDALSASTEPWMIENVYKKLMSGCMKK